MKYKPYEYQQFATEYIIENPIAAVFLQCGLGKSVITLTAIHELVLDRFEVQRVLVIAPLRVARETWPDEISKWDHLKGLTYSIAVGSEKERRTALMQDTHIHIINRENVHWLIEKSGLPFDYDMVIIDELSSFKSHTAQRFKSLLKVRYRINRIVGLTGTPSSNGLIDLFAQFRILDGGKRLGRYITQYRNEYFTPDKMNGPQVFSWRPRPGAEDVIYSKISDITISMKSTDYLKMPECICTTVLADMSPHETKVYNKLKKELVIQLGSTQIDAKNAAALSGKLCQLACGAVYADDKTTVLIHNRKLDALDNLIEAANGNPVLIAYWFKHDLVRIQKRFPEACELKTGKDITNWNAGKLPVALIHPASAGHGLNLQAGGSTLIWFGLTWSLELYQQTNARLWRQGQQSDTVVIHHIITKGTIDEQIMEALSKKDQTQNALINAVKAQLEVR